MAFSAGPRSIRGWVDRCCNRTSINPKIVCKMDDKIKLAKCLPGDKLSLEFQEEALCLFIPVRFLFSGKVSSLFELDCLAEYHHGK